MFGLEPLQFWGWVFLSFYLGLMIVFGFVGMNRIKKTVTISPQQDLVMAQFF